MKKLLLIGIGFILIIMAISNPDLETHKAKVSELISDSTQPKSNNQWEALGEMLGQSLVDQMLDQVVHVDNYVVFSLTNFNWKGNKAVIGLGVFGNVFIISEFTNKFDINEFGKKSEKNLN